MQKNLQIPSAEIGLRHRRGRKTVVIADDGGHASLIFLDRSQSTTTGARFEHRGRTWVITGHRHHSRVLVAEPVPVVSV